MTRIVTLLLLGLCIVISSQEWAGHVKQLAGLKPPDVYAGAEFGSSVAISGTTVVVGQSSAGRSGRGHAYIYLESSGTNIVATLADGGANTGFGYALAMTSDTNAIVVGSPAGLNPHVYVFIRPTGGWAGGLQNTLPTAALSVGGGRTYLGCAVAISNDGTTVVVGAKGAQAGGAVYVFVRPSGGWQDTTTPTATLSAASAVGLGSSVGITNDAVLAGSNDFNTPGEAYVFVEPPSGWQDAQPTAVLTPSDGNVADDFGASVAIRDNTIVVGAPRHLSVGAAYVFVEPPNGWQNMTQTAELGIQVQGLSDLGVSVALGDNVVLAGDPVTNEFQGSAVAYLKPSGGWEDTTTPDLLVTPSNTKEGASFGTAVAIDAPNAVIGAPLGAVQGRSQAGTAWVFGEQ